MSNLRERFLEECFLLQNHLNMTYSDIRSLPLPYRRWFIDRLSKEFKNREEQHKKHQRERSAERGQRVQELPMGEMNVEAQRSARQRTEKKFK